MATRQLLTALLASTFALASASPVWAAGSASSGPASPLVVTSDSRILAHPTNAINGRPRSMLTGALVGQHVEHDEVWDVAIAFQPRQELPPLLTTTWKNRRTEGPAVNRIAAVPARLILRGTEEGRTKIVGTALHDFGWGHDGVLMDGDVTLRVLRKVRLAAPLANEELSDLATSTALTAPEAHGDVVYLAPEPR